MLVAISAYLRTRSSAASSGWTRRSPRGSPRIRSAQIPGLLRHDGYPPLYYFLLHFWIQALRDQRGSHALAVGAVRRADDPGRVLGRLQPLRPPRRPIRRDPVRVQPVPHRLREETRMYELMGLLGILATVAFIHAFVFRRRKLPDHVRGLPGADALHPRVGDVLRGRRGGRADPDLADQRRPPRARAGRAAGVRRRRDPVPPLAAELPLPGGTHGGAVGAAAAVRGAGPDLARPARRRPDHGRAADRAGHRAGEPVHQALPAHPARRR